MTIVSSWKNFQETLGKIGYTSIRTFLPTNPIVNMEISGKAYDDGKLVRTLDYDMRLKLSKDWKLIYEIYNTIPFFPNKFLLITPRKIGIDGKITNVEDLIKNKTKLSEYEGHSYDKRSYIGFKGDFPEIEKTMIKLNVHEVPYVTLDCRDNGVNNMWLKSVDSKTLPPIGEVSNLPKPDSHRFHLSTEGSDEKITRYVEKFENAFGYISQENSEVNRK